MNLETFLESNALESDELGRIIIKDLSLLEKINGAVGSAPEFMRPDVGCGNTNCVC